jgi:hypothetical protein
MKTLDVEQAVFQDFVSVIRQENCVGPFYGVLQAALEARPIRIKQAGRLIQMLNTPEELVAYLEKLLASLDELKETPPRATKYSSVPKIGSTTI